MIGNLHSSSRPARWAHKPKNPIISRSGHGEHFSRMQPRTTWRPGNTCRLLSESGGIRHGGSRPLNRQGLRNVEFDGPGVRSGVNPDSPTTLACGTTLPARGYSFSTAAFRFPRHPIFAGGQEYLGQRFPVARSFRWFANRLQPFWQSEMRSHPFPKVRVGAAYKEEGIRFARHPFQIVALKSYMSIPTTAHELCLEGGIS